MIAERKNKQAGEVSLWVFCPFFNFFFFFFFLLLSCISCFYILEIKPLSFVSFKTIFSHFVGCLFFFLMVSFVVQKLISLIRSLWCIFAFISVALGDWPKKTFIQLIWENVFPMFFRRRYADGHEKILSITDYQRNANKNYYEVPPHTYQKGHH